MRSSDGYVGFIFDPVNEIIAVIKTDVPGLVRCALENVRICLLMAGVMAYTTDRICIGVPMGCDGQQYTIILLHTAECAKFVGPHT